MSTALTTHRTPNFHIQPIEAEYTITGDELKARILECGFNNPAQFSIYLGIRPQTMYSWIKYKDRPIPNARLFSVFMICYRDCIQRRLADQAQLVQSDQSKST